MSALLANRTRLVAALAGLNLLLAGAGWFVLVAPQRHHGQSASQQLQQVQQQVTQLIGAAATQPTPAKQPTIHTSNLYRLNTAMPVTADEPDLMLALGHYAKASGVKVLTLSPGSPSAAVGYVTLPVQLTLSGSYGSLTRYLHTLRTLVSLRHGRLFASGRLLAVTSVALSPVGKGRDETATVALDAYVYGPVNGVAPESTSTTSTSTTSTSTTTTTGG